MPPGTSEGVDGVEVANDAISCPSRTAGFLVDDVGVVDDGVLDAVDAVGVLDVGVLDAAIDAGCLDGAVNAVGVLDFGVLGAAIDAGCLDGAVNAVGVLDVVDAGVLDAVNEAGVRVADVGAFDDAGFLEFLGDVGVVDDAGVLEFLSDVGVLGDVDVVDVAEDFLARFGDGFFSASRTFTVMNLLGPSISSAWYLFVCS